MTTTTGTITATGLGSGIDVNGLVSQLMTAESAPLTQLNAQEAGYQATLTAYGQVSSALSTFQTAATGLESASAFQPVAATSGNPALFSATAGTNAVPANYAVGVNQLAQSQSLASGAFTSTDTDVGTGTLTFQFGTTDSSGNFTLNGAAATQNVTINSSDDTLSGIVNAINAANIGVSATIINDGTGYRLSLTSSNTGAANSMKITVSNDGDGNNVDNNGLSQLAYDPAGSVGNGQNMSQTVAAQDAQLTVNGLSITNPSNTITDAVQGVTLNLLSTSSTPTTLNVANNSSSIQTALQNFVSAYNTLYQNLYSLTSYNSTTSQAGLLYGDSTVKLIESQMKSILSSSIPGLNASYDQLPDIGIQFQVDGTLSLDSSQLQTALNANPNAAAGLFSSGGTTTDSQISYDSATANTVPGTYNVNVSQLATQGYTQGVANSALTSSNGTFTTPVVINSGNNTFSLSVDGVQSGTISISPGSYTSAAALTAEIQSQINGDSALSAAGSSVTVSLDNTTGSLCITSNRYGSASSVVVTGAGTNTLGLTSGLSSTAGVDVAGTINGVPATGSGQYLTGATGSAAAGLALLVSGGALGARGTVSYVQGFAEQLDNLVSNALGPNGPLATRTNSVNQSITTVENKITDMNQYLATMQQQYLKEFNAMDVIVSQMNSTSEYLSSILGSGGSSAVTVGGTSSSSNGTSTSSSSSSS